jgi:transposase
MQGHPARPGRRSALQVVFERCCALDVHKKTVVACVLLSPASAQSAASPTSPEMPAPSPVEFSSEATSQEPRAAQKHVRTFGTMTDDLLALSDWLTGLQVSHVAMESTGVYWKPIWNLLEGGFELLLVNAQHVKAVPGRKSDVKDAEWLCDLLRHGLLRASFVPDRPQRELRELTRYRASLVHERTACVNRLQKTLEGCNIKLPSVVSDVTGLSARAMLGALIEGQAEPAVMADLAEGKLRKKIPELVRALTGRVGSHQRFLLAQQLEHLDYLDGAIAEVGREISERMRPFAEDLERLDAIPGVGRRIAETIGAEMGSDMSRFPSERHLASWAGLSPGLNESAGKRKSAKTRKGCSALKVALIEAAHAAARTKDCFLSALYHRLAARRGKKRAIVAVAHRILVIAYHILKRHEPYRELGTKPQNERHREGIEKRLIRKLEDLGNKVTLQRLPTPA